MAGLKVLVYSKKTQNGVLNNAILDFFKEIQKKKIVEIVTIHDKKKSLKLIKMYFYLNSKWNITKKKKSNNDKKRMLFK